MMVYTYYNLRDIGQFRTPGSKLSGRHYNVIINRRSPFLGELLFRRSPFLFALPFDRVFFLFYISRDFHT